VAGSISDGLFDSDVVAPGDGQLSLREAIEQASGSGGPDTIRFSAAVVGQTLVLTGGELSITGGDNKKRPRRITGTAHSTC
jgi:hypothetical protein